MLKTPVKINIYELYNLKKNKELKSINTFNHILNNCNIKIQQVAQHGGMSLYYNIPKIIIGYPLYDYNKCVEYIIEQLKISGLYIHPLEAPNYGYIYISWKIQDLSSKFKSKLLLS